MHESPCCLSLKAVADVTGEEFRTFMAILSSLNIMADAHQELADIVTEQADLRQPFQVLQKFSYMNNFFVLFNIILMGLVEVVRGILQISFHE